MRDAEAFDDTAFLGLARQAKRDPYRLALFAQHLGPGEQPRILLPVRGGTLLVTDQRLIELRAHLEVHGAWNVKEFQGYVVHRAIDRGSVQELAHVVRPATDGVGSRQVEDRIIVTTTVGPEDILVSRGPEGTLSAQDFDAVRTAVLAPQPK